MNTQEQRLAILFGTLLALLLTFAPDILQAQKMTSSSSRSSHVTNTKTGKTTIKFDNGRTDYRIEYEGEIRISDDDKDIVGISRGG
ncbi:MAG: hypothetical protein WBA74_03120, partial [Cyclobacteriaceae bacterium]